MSKVADCQKLLIAESEKKGFLTFDDIMDMSDAYSLSVSEVDQREKRWIRYSDMNSAG